MMALATLMRNENQVSSSAPEERNVYSYNRPTNDLAPEERNVSLNMDPIITSNPLSSYGAYRNTSSWAVYRHFVLPGLVAWSQEPSKSKRYRTLPLINLAACCLIAVITWNSAIAWTYSATLHSQTLFVQSSAAAQAKPSPPARWRGLIGEYGPDNDILIILEKDGQLCALFKRTELETLGEVSKNVFKFRSPQTAAGQYLDFKRDARGRATQLEIIPNPWAIRQRLAKDVLLASTVLKRRHIEPESGNQLRIKPVRPVSELVKEALVAPPPKEAGDFRRPDLVELTKLDNSIKLDIRYATTNNFLGTVFYSQPRAFMQRPAAEALVRVSRKLKAQGYGLLVHDAYRPWYVTKVFWDATPEDKHVFVADPSKGSRHNRGCAVDLTLYDLKTGKPVEMVSTYDETTDRAYPNYPGGTSLQRWHRELLRSAMESEGFTVYEAEWWHFDYKDWQKYPIMNVRFESIGRIAHQVFGVPASACLVLQPNNLKVEL